MIQVDEFGLDIQQSEPRLGLTKAVRDTLGRAKLSIAYTNLKASGLIPESAQVKPAPASDVALIAAAYQFLQESGQLPLEQPDIVVCVHSSDEVHDFFERHGLSACADKLCEHLGIESAEDLKLITVEDLQGSKFSAWAHGSLTLVQHKKVLKAFS